VLASLVVARQFLYEHWLRARMDKLDETLRFFRSVEGAKNILMENRKQDNADSSSQRIIE